MDWHNIPSLSSLRAFEATSRLGGFSAAARELNVTHAAIAQHVRALERYFGRTLVFRAGRRMDLTEAGKRLANALHDGFGQIQAGVQALQEESLSMPLQVTLTPTFAENWLMPRLAGFWAKHPGIELSMKPSIRLSDLRLENLDLAIRYGSGTWPGYDSELLTETSIAIVVSPKLLHGRTHLTIQEMEALPWLLESQVSEHRVWAEQQGINLGRVHATQFDTNNLVMSAVRAGYGIAIQAVALVERDLADGTLISLLETPETDLGYYLVTLNDHQSPKLETFLKWLRRCAHTKLAQGEKP